MLRVTPESAGWTYVGFSVYVLEDGRRLELGEAGRETCVVVLAGRCHFAAGGREWRDQGRENVFAGRPAALYVPPGTAWAAEGAGRTSARSAST